MRTRLLVALATLVALLGAVGLVALLSSSEPAPVTVTVNDPADGGIAPKVLEVPAEAVEQAADALSGEAAADIDGVSVESADHTSSRDESPAGAAADELADRSDAVDENREALDPLPTAGASAGFVGCRTQFVQNQSSRRGVRPTVQVLHYTVSPNRPGWSDVDAITAFFNRSSSQASSHFIIDAEGNCAYIVPIEAKAWTQAGGNPFAVSYEIIATGRESSYLGTAGYAKLRSVAAQVAKRTGIPTTRGAISGCSPSKSGIVEHRDGGTCWGGHVDISPFSMADVLSRVSQREPVIERWSEANFRLGILTPGERDNAKCLLFARRVAVRNGGWGKVGPAHLANAVRCKSWLQARNRELHRLGHLSTPSRRARHDVIHALI